MNFKFTLILIVLIITFSCKKDNGVCLRPAGPESTKTIMIDSVNHLFIYDNLNVELINSDSNYIEVISYENLIEGINISRANNNLLLNNLNRCAFFRKYEKNEVKVKLYHNTQIKSIEIYDAASVTSVDTLKGGRIDIVAWDNSGSYNFVVDTDSCWIRLHTGPTDLEISGKSNKTYVYTASDAYIDTRNLNSKNVQVDHRGTNNLYVSGVNIANISTLWTGNVFLNSNIQDVNFTKRGEGDLYFY